MTSIKYISAAKDPSGYGEAARQFIMALWVAGVNITTETIKQMPESTDYGFTGKLLDELENRKIDYKINIIHLTPDLIPQYAEKGKYNISHLFWECDRLPKEWIKPLNDIDCIWTASSQMCEMIKNSGVSTPCYAFPQPIWTDRAVESIKPFIIPHAEFVFYSIFQWIDRKNPKTLLRAYWRAFEGNDKVALLLKTYRITYLPNEFELIKEDIKRWKSELGLSHYPKIYLCKELLTEPQMARLHKTGDCFINPSSGEGWNRPLQEALLFGNPVISADNGGITDYPIPYHKVESKEVEVTSQSHIPWYYPPLRWKEIDEKGLANAMKRVYSSNKESKEAQNYVVNNFNYKIVGEQMKNRLEQILL